MSVKNFIALLHSHINLKEEEIHCILFRFVASLLKLEGFENKREIKLEDVKKFEKSNKKVVELKNTLALWTMDSNQMLSKKVEVCFFLIFSPICLYSLTLSKRFIKKEKQESRVSSLHSHLC